MSPGRVPGPVLAGVGLGLVAGALDVGSAVVALEPGAAVGVATGLAAMAGAFVAVPRPLVGAVLLLCAGSASVIADLVGAGAGVPRLLPGAAGLLAAALVTAPTVGRTSTVQRVVVAAGLGLHAALGLPLATLGLVAPDWAVVGLLLVWAGLLVVALRGRQAQPWLVPAAPAATAVLAALVLWMGGSLLGWQA
jgi:hypothetical protein